MNIYDDNGNIVGSVGPDDRVYDGHGMYVGQRTATGGFRGPAGAGGFQGADPMTGALRFQAPETAPEAAQPYGEGGHDQSLIGNFLGTILGWLLAPFLLGYVLAITWPFDVKHPWWRKTRIRRWSYALALPGFICGLTVSMWQVACLLLDWLFNEHHTVPRVLLMSVLAWLSSLPTRRYSCDESNRAACVLGGWVIGLAIYGYSRFF